MNFLRNLVDFNGFDGFMGLRFNKNFTGWSWLVWGILPIFGNHSTTYILIAIHKSLKFFRPEPHFDLQSENNFSTINHYHLEDVYPLGTIPTLEVTKGDETSVITGSWSIYRYLANELNLYGECSMDKAVSDQIGDVIRPLFEETTIMNFTPGTPEEKVLSLFVIIWKLPRAPNS